MIRMINRFIYFTLAAALVFVMTIKDAQAKGGAHSMSFGVSFSSLNQKDLNAQMDAISASTYSGSFTTKNLTSAYEFFGQYAYRFGSTMMSLVVRPSYMTQSSSGTCGAGNCNYSLTGLTLYPLLRITPLENSFIKFFMQTGIGYGSISASVTENSASGSFSGYAIGQMVGMGASFCFTDTHCLTLEGNLRYHPIERNISSGATGTFANTGFSQFNSSGEVEYGGSDLATTLSGFQGILAYTMNF